MHPLSVTTLMSPKKRGLKSLEKEKMSKKKATTVVITFYVLLLANTILVGIINCQTNSDNQSTTSYSQVSVESNIANNVSEVIINEFMADNGITIAGPDGNSPDWIELYNSGAETVDLAGMYLTDDLTDPTCWQFPENSVIESGKYMIIWADTDGGEGYVTFSLNANGEEIGLFASDGVTLIDSVVFTKQLQDVSYGRDPDDNSVWDYLPTATPGSANRYSVGGETSVWSLLIIVVLFAVVTAVVVVIGKLNTKRK